VGRTSGEKMVSYKNSVGKFKLLRACPEPLTAGFRLLKTLLTMEALCLTNLCVSSLEAFRQTPIETSKSSVKVVIVIQSRLIGLTS
jgi:hypothetical protein